MTGVKLFNGLAKKNFYSRIKIFRMYKLPIKNRVKQRKSEENKINSMIN